MPSCELGDKRCRLLLSLTSCIGEPDKALATIYRIGNAFREADGGELVEQAADIGALEAGMLREVSDRCVAGLAEASQDTGHRSGYSERP